MGRKEELLFEKRSKNSCAAVADYPATAAKSFLVLFFKKELLPYLACAVSHPIRAQVRTISIYKCARASAAFPRRERS
jgi:hypothetical protein